MAPQEQVLKRVHFLRVRPFCDRIAPRISFKIGFKLLALT